MLQIPIFIKTKTKKRELQNVFWDSYIHRQLTQPWSRGLVCYNEPLCILSEVDPYSEFWPPIFYFLAEEFRSGLALDKLTSQSNSGVAGLSLTGV